MTCRPRRSDIEILAGTVACPQCCGKGQYQRHTPNFARFFGLQEPWQDEVGSGLRCDAACPSAQCACLSLWRLNCHQEGRRRHRHQALHASSATVDRVLLHSFERPVQRRIELIPVGYAPQVALRLSTMYNGAQNRPPTRPRQMLEYPGVPPPKPPRFIDRTLLTVLTAADNLPTFSARLLNGPAGSPGGCAGMSGHPGLGDRWGMWCRDAQRSHLCCLCAQSCRRRGIQRQRHRRMPMLCLV
jgi:hypothetical protein